MKSVGKSCLSAATLIAAIGFAGTVSAQPAPSFAQLQSPTMSPWMQDDGSSSDYPIPMPSDRSGDALNSQYRDGFPVAPPNGFPAPYRIR